MRENNKVIFLAIRENSWIVPVVCRQVLTNYVLFTNGNKDILLEKETGDCRYCLTREEAEEWLNPQKTFVIKPRASFVRLFCPSRICGRQLPIFNHESDTDEEDTSQWWELPDSITCPSCQRNFVVDREILLKHENEN